MSTETKGIHLSDIAGQRAREMADTNPEYAGKSLRLYLDGKGCDGFFYGVTFDTAQKDDTIFPQNNAPAVLVDERTLLFVDGSSIEWVDDERGQGFLVENPNHKKFRGKFYKRPSWQSANKDILS